MSRRTTPSLTAAFWSYFRARNQLPDADSNEPRPPQETCELSPVLEAESSEAALGAAAISGRPKTSRPPDGRSRESGVHSRLTLERSHTIYHVGGREIPNAAAVGGNVLSHLRDLCLRLLDGEERARVIFVTGEPALRAAKSQVAAKLATMLSGDYGPGVLAMEGDPVAPALHEALGFSAPRGFGLCEQLERLAGERSGHVSVVQLNQRMAALVSRDPSPVTSEWQACFQAVLAQLRGEHEYIIVDGPVAGNTADVAHLQQADGVLFLQSEGTKLTQTLANAAERFPDTALIRIVAIATPTSGHNSRVSWRASLRRH